MATKSCKNSAPPSACAFRAGIRAALAGSRKPSPGEAPLVSALANDKDGFRDPDSTLAQSKRVGLAVNDVARRSIVHFHQRRKENQEVSLPPSLLAPIG